MIHKIVKVISIIGIIIAFIAFLSLVYSVLHFFFGAAVSVGGINRGTTHAGNLDFSFFGIPQVKP